AATRPAFQPGARPPGGGFIESTSSPVRAINQAMIEFEFHISPVRSSSRPHTRIGICGTNSSKRRASARSSLSRRGLSTASPKPANKGASMALGELVESYSDLPIKSRSRVDSHYKQRIGGHLSRHGSFGPLSEGHTVSGGVCFNDEPSQPTRLPTEEGLVFKH